jgi:TnpA family transposase
MASFSLVISKTIDTSTHLEKTQADIRHVRHTRIKPEMKYLGVSGRADIICDVRDCSEKLCSG